ncbi:DUF1801 domain-containing protein [Lysinibacter cavernae]|uniref:DUF1801 domain-containing protein n=1 Tax=Lysinibacter cavernae TaxID=1640652 RepID=UPI0036184084
MSAAGIITNDSAEFLQMIEASPESIREFGVAARDLIAQVDPNMVEVVWPKQRTAGYGVGPKKLSEQYIWLAPYTKHFVFGFYYATELDDPALLLEGTGQLMRHVKIRSMEQLQQTELRTLVEASVAHMQEKHQ